MHFSFELNPFRWIHGKRQLQVGLFVLGLPILGLAQSAAITEIEVNQALGKQHRGAMHFFAGKNTIVRAFLDAAITVDPEQTKLTVSRAGADPIELRAKVYDEPVNVVEFPCPTREACNNWAEGRYTFNATVNGVSRSSEETVYEFKARIKLRILVKPVKSNYAGTIKTIADNKWKTAWSYLQSVFPVAADGIVWDVQDEFDASDMRFDLETEPGRSALWEGLTSLVPQKCAANPKADGCFDLVVGFIPERPNGNLQGYTYGRPTNIVVASDEDMPATIPHEIAHIFSAGDTYDGGGFHCAVNPAPDGYNGKDFNNQENTVSCTEGKRAFPTASATLIPADARPYEVGGRGALTDTACFMGSGGKMSDFWISPEVYATLFQALDPAKAAAPEKTAQVRKASAPERLLYFSGFINKKNEVRKDPWYSYMGTEIPTDSTGDLMLRALGAGDAVVASQKLTVSFNVLSNPPVAIENAPFTGAVRFPQNAVKFQIVRRDPADSTKLTVLWESNVSESDPELSAVFADATEVVNDAKTISWTAKTSSGKALAYLVEFNPNVADPASDWIVIAADLNEAKWDEDFSFLPGGNDARIRVTATDGIRATATESKAFKVPFKAPEIYLKNLASVTLKQGLDLDLSAEVEDVQDDFIPDAKLVWTSSISGPLGNGLDVVAKRLVAGEHTITFTATNSAGLSSSQSIKVTVR